MVYAAKNWIDLALVACGRPIKLLCRAQGVARSDVHELHDRSQDWCDGRTGRMPSGDAQLLAQICE